uniref:NOP14 nucleolar protein homolog (yeast) n=1 Tax=Sinocyclocheilus grahami TaxID=75366 RepID=A0A672LV99_SINGR
TEFDKRIQSQRNCRNRIRKLKDMYNLNEEEELTHYGQSLAEMEKMTDVIDSNSDSEEKGLLSAELTATHFGGGGEGGEEEDDAADDDDEEEEEEEDEEDDHCDLQSDGGSEDEDGEGAEEEQVGAEEPPAVSEEQKKAAQEAARAELPYTFIMILTVCVCVSVCVCVCVCVCVWEHGSEQQRLILDRTLKCHRPSLAAGNKAKLQKLFGFLLEYVGELATQNPPDLRSVSALVPQICGLCQMFPEAACKAVQTLLSDCSHSMEETLEVKGRAAMPDLDMLVLLKITALLFPSSDFRHPVTTPAFLYISQCAVVSLEDVCKGLILCCLALEFVSLSQRFFPELLNFPLGLLHLTLPNKHNTGYTVVSPFRRASHSSQNPSGESSGERPLLSVIDSCLDLVKRCTSLYKDLPSFAHIFQPIRTLLLKHLPVEGYPAPIQDLHREILEAIPEQPSQHAPLVFKKKKPIPLKLFTPKIVQIRNTTEEKERERLQHKYKREFKGAPREMRKDTRFLAREKLSDVMSRDAERKRKVKELYGSLATQEGENKRMLCSETLFM